MSVPFTVEICSGPIDTPEFFHENIYNNVKSIACCMHGGRVSNSEWNLYNDMILNGYKRKGEYELRLPHLIRLECTPFNLSAVHTWFKCRYSKDTKQLKNKTIAVWPPNERKSGLYVGSMTIKLSNPLWRLEYTEYDWGKKTWVMDEVLKNIPEGASKTCTATIAVTFESYNSSLPQDPDPVPKPWFEGLTRFHEEFRRVFMSQE